MESNYPIVGNNKRINQHIILNNDGNEIIENPSKIANICNKCFCTVADSLREKILLDLPLLQQNESGFKRKNIYYSLFFNPTSVTEITNIANLLSNRKASGFHKITPLVQKTILGDVADVLVYLVNLSLTSGVFRHIKKSNNFTIIQEVRKIQPNILSTNSSFIYLF